MASRLPTRGVDRYLVIDVEATVSPDASIRDDERETIEIGALSVDARDLRTLAEFETLVRPVRHPSLGAFCTSITSITQEMVDGAPAFSEALAALTAAMPMGPGTVFASWGMFDRNQLRRDCSFHGVRYPLPTHVNLKRAFSDRLDTNERYGLPEALGMCGLSLAGRHHRALDDARSVARLLAFILGRAGGGPILSPGRRG